MRTLGIDPSLTCTGWSIVENGIVKSSGTIKTKAKQSLEQRLWFIYHEMCELLHDTSPDRVAIEDIFIYQKKSMQTPVKTIQVHGIIKGAVFSRYAPEVVYRYMPTTVKLTVAGHGKATKEQVLQMVQRQAGYKGEQLDISDAIAVALTCERDARK
jgi:crossover junction endodeoxyribonuclease RuvC